MARRSSSAVHLARRLRGIVPHLEQGGQQGVAAERRLAGQQLVENRPPAALLALLPAPLIDRLASRDEHQGAPEVIPVAQLRDPLPGASGRQTWTGNWE
jgi:hypothetical protein